MKNLTATYKGIITGVLMILISIGIIFTAEVLRINCNTLLISCTSQGSYGPLIGYRQSAAESKTLKSYFSQGFRCFIVITLMMVVFTWVFLLLNPGLKEEMAQQYRGDLVKKGNYTPPEIDAMVLKAKEYFTTMLISMAIFGYLLIGSLVTLIGAAFLSQKKD